MGRYQEEESTNGLNKLINRLAAAYLPMGFFGIAKVCQPNPTNNNS